MNAIFITSNLNYLNNQSEEWNKLTKILTRFTLLHIILIKKEKGNAPPVQMSDHVWVYPIYSRFDWIIRSKLKDLIEKNMMWKNAFSADVIISDDPLTAGKIGLVIAKKYSKNWILNVFEDYWSYKTFSLYGGRNKPLDKNVVLKNAYKIYAGTSKIQSEIGAKASENEKSKILRFPYFLDLESLRNVESKMNIKTKYPQFGFTLLSICPLEKESNLDIALLTLQKLRLWNPHISLLIVGYGKEKSNIEKMAEELGLKDSVIIEKVADDLISYIRTCNVFVLWSRDLDETNIFALTALSVGAVVLLPDCPFSRQYIIDGENGMIAKNPTPEGYFQNIFTIISHNELQTMFRLNSDTKIEEKLNLQKDQYEISLENLWI